MNPSVMPFKPLGSLLSVPSFLLVLSSSKCATCTAGILAGWVPFSFCSGKKLIALGLLVLLAVWLWDGSITFLLSLPHCPEIIRVHLLIGTGLQVGYHCFEPFRQSTVEVVTLQLSYVVWRKAFWEWHCKNLVLSQQMHPQSNTVSLSHICSWKSSWFKASKVLTLLLSSSRGEWCNLSNQHNDTPLNPSTDFGRWWHLSCPHPWRLAGWFSYGLWTPCGIAGHSLNARNLQIYWILMTLMRKLTPNFGHSQTCDLVRVMGGGLAHGSCHPWPQSQPFCNAWPHSWYDGLGSCLGTSHHSAAVGSLAAHGDWSWLWQLHGGNAGRRSQLILHVLLHSEGMWSLPFW